MTSLTPYSETIPVVDSRTGTLIYEKVWGKSLLDLLYGDTNTRSWKAALRSIIAKAPVISWAWGKYNDCSYTRKKISAFCQEYHINEKEFERQIKDFSSFNDFFVRKLRPETRPIDPDRTSLVAPADARYTFIPDITQDMPFTIKGHRFQLASFLGSEREALQYEGGTLVIARLCPIDCHRYVFPLEATIIDGPKEISGPLYSVSPIATSKFPWIWWHNKRVITTLQTVDEMTYCMAEVGATNCGTIVETFGEKKSVQKGEEKGYFRLGGSAILLLFPKGSIQIDTSLLKLQSDFGTEVYCHYGQKIANLVSSSS